MFRLLQKQIWCKRNTEEEEAFHLVGRRSIETRGGADRGRRNKLNSSRVEGDRRELLPLGLFGETYKAQ